MTKLFNCGIGPLVGQVMTCDDVEIEAQILDPSKFAAFESTVRELLHVFYGGFSINEHDARLDFRLARQRQLYRLLDTRTYS